MKKKIDNQSALFEPFGIVMHPADVKKIQNLSIGDDNLPKRNVESFGKMYIGFDNGVSASMTIMDLSGAVYFYKVPTKIEQSYTKAKQNITRIDTPKLIELLRGHIDVGAECFTHAILERPMVNPTRFKATMSALRALEALLIVVELLQLPHSYIDSRKWQKELLPSGLETDELKQASLDIGNRLFPQFIGHKHKDRDSLLMTEYARRNRL